MDRVSKSLCLLLVVILAVPSLLIIMPIYAQSSVPEFTLEYVDHSYDVPPTLHSSTDPYTNKTTTTTIPGYHVDNKTIDSIIKNNIGASYYNFRYKPHYGDNWACYPFNPNLGNHYIIPSAVDLSSTFAASSSDYTIVSLTFIPKNLPENGEVDVQVQALFGDFEKHPSYMMGAGFPTYDFTFIGEVGNWSDTQTITIPAANSSLAPSPTVPELSWLAFLPLCVLVLSIALVLKRRHNYVKSYSHDWINRAIYSHLKLCIFNP